MTMTEKKDEAVRTRVRFQEKEAFTRLAKRLGVKPARLLRRLMREAVNDETDLFDPGLATLSEATNQLAAVGRNLNQIAKAVNEGRVIADPISKFEIDQLHVVVADLDKAFRGVVKRSRSRSVTRSIVK